MSIKKIDAGLSRYYKLWQRDYFDDEFIGKFEAACEEDGFGEEDIQEELQTSAEECMVLDFDDNFPGVKNNNLESIFTVIKKCYNDPYAYSLVVNKDHFTIEQDKLEEKTINPLKSHCKTIFGKEFEDKSLINMLYIE
eukprot:521706_1